jgi:hypothetical protein
MQYSKVSGLKSCIGRVEREIVAMVCNYSLQKPSILGLRDNCLSTWIALPEPLSARYRTKHGTATGLLAPATGRFMCAPAGMLANPLLPPSTGAAAGCRVAPNTCITGGGAPAGGGAAAAPEGVRSQARRHSPPPPCGGHW